MILGLTGHSGSGKTTAAKIFERLGFYHLDCDRLVHTRVYTDPQVLSALRTVFGDSVVGEGAVDRRALASIVFSSEEQYNRLMSTVMPFIKSAILADIAAHPAADVLLDAPALFEFALEQVCDKTVAVVSDMAIPRILARDGISEKEAAARLSHQQPQSFYSERCDFVIRNNGTLCELEAEIEKICKIIEKGGSI